MISPEELKYATDFIISIIRLSAKRHQRGYETRALSLVKIVCYTVYGSVRYTTQAVEVSGGVV